MCGLAGGRLMVNLKYISKSFEARRWLDPEDPKFLVLPELCQDSR